MRQSGRNAWDAGNRNAAPWLHVASTELDNWQQLVPTHTRHDWTARAAAPSNECPSILPRLTCLSTSDNCLPGKILSSWQNTSRPCVGGCAAATHYLVISVTSHLPHTLDTLVSDRNSRPLYSNNRNNRPTQMSYWLLLISSTFMSINTQTRLDQGKLVHEPLYSLIYYRYVI